MARPTTRRARDMPTVAVRGLVPVIELVELRKPSAALALCEEMGLGPSLRSRPDERVPADVLVRLLERASMVLAEPHLGLRLAAGHDLRRFELLGFVLHHSPDMREALRRSSRFHKILNGALRPELEEGPTAVLKFVVDASVARQDGMRHLLELATATAVGMLRRFVDPAFAPLRVDFEVPPPADVAPLEALFNAPVAWRKPVTAITLPAALLASRPRGADPELGKMLVRFAEDFVRQLPDEPRTWAERVRLSLHEAADGSPDIRTVARRLGVSSRSLQRRLLEETTTFAELEDQVRRERAMRYVEASDLDMSSITYLLGFNDVSAFYRAFRRWTGTTPLQRRQALVGS